ncbi:hypothetical protein [Pseudogemmobacter sonorensis]|uniref:hypothetical protein n=1 Tax=Pseudogemmobacter sonorensis TaxID=2989681 RepID=UPI0036869700
MKNLLQLLGVGAFGAAGWAAFLMTQDQGAPTVTTTTAVSGPAAAAETGAPAGLTIPRIAPRVALLPVGGPPSGAAGTALISGLPGYGRLAFLLPRQSRVTEAEARVVFTSEMPEGVNATLRISVNGQRRAEVMLPAGRDEREVTIPLAVQDLSRNALQLSFAITGVSTGALCGPHIGNALVTLQPGTRLDVLTARPISGTDDRFRAAGGIVTLAWPEDGTAQDGIGGGFGRPLADAEAAKLLDLAARAMREGMGLSFRPATGATEGAFLATTEELARMLAAPDPWRGGAQAPSWPLEIASGASGAALRSFTGSQSWRYAFSGADLPDDRMPGAIEYGLKLGPIATGDGRDIDGGGWLVSVTYNGHLIEAFNAGEGTLRRRAALPEGLTGQGNLLEISVGRGFGVDGACNDGPPLVAELLDDSVLLPGPAMPDGIDARLGRLLGTAPALEPDGTARLTLPEAQAAARLLADLPGFGIDGGSGTGGARLSVVRIIDLIESGQQHPEGWLYLRDGDGRALVRVDDAARTGQLADHAVGLLIRPAGAAPTPVGTAGPNAPPPAIGSGRAGDGAP